MRACVYAPLRQGSYFVYFTYTRSERHDGEERALESGPSLPLPVIAVKTPAPATVGGGFTSRRRFSFISHAAAAAAFRPFFFDFLPMDAGFPPTLAVTPRALGLRLRFRPGQAGKSPI